MRTVTAPGKCQKCPCVTEYLAREVQLIWIPGEETKHSPHQNDSPIDPQPRTLSALYQIATKINPLPSNRFFIKISQGSGCQMLGIADQLGGLSGDMGGFDQEEDHMSIEERALD